MVRFGDTLDETVHAQAAQIIGNASGGVLARLVPKQGSKMLAEVLVSEGAADEEEEKQDMDRAWTRGSAKRRAAARQLSTVTSFCISWKKASPMKQ